MAKILEAARFVDIKTGCSYRYVNSKTEYFREHSHDYYEIFIMLDGEALHQVNGETVRLFPRDAVFIRASDTHNYSEIAERPFSFLNLTFTKDTLDAILDYLSEGYPRKRLLNSKIPPTVSFSDDDFIALSREMEKIRAISPEDAKRRKTAVRALLMKLFSDVFLSFESDEAPVPEWLTSTVEKTRSEMRFAEGISGMVEISGKTREHLTRSLKKYFGKSPSEFINELRLNYIANMLRNSNHKILDIIYGSGFNTVSHASTLFFKQYGVSMSDYRKGSKPNETPQIAKTGYNVN